MPVYSSESLRAWRRARRIAGLSAGPVEFGEEVGVLLPVRGDVGSVLHLEHDRDIFDPVAAEVTQDVVALGSARGVVVLANWAFGNASARTRLNSFSQCCSRFSPSSLTESLAFQS